MARTNILSDRRRRFSVLPVTSLGLQHEASDECISSGVARLDTMLGGKGFYRGWTILVSGTAGTGKTSLAASFVDAACRRGERCLMIVRGISGPNDSQYAIDWFGSGTVVQAKTASVSFQPGHILWTGDRPRDHPQDRPGVPTEGGGPGSNWKSHSGGEPARRLCGTTIFASLIS